MKLVEEAVAASKFSIDTIISGGAKGVDSLAKRYAKDNRIDFEEYPADWNDLEAPGAIIKEGQYGKYNSRAGFDRNQIMANIADACIAIQIDDTSGTQDMITRCTERGIPVFVYPKKKFIKKEEKYRF